MSVSSDYEPDYLAYHDQVTQAENLIILGKYNQAYDLYTSVIDSYPFVFLRDYQVATQLAWKVGNQEQAFQFLRKGIMGGWKMGSIKKNNYLSDLRSTRAWKLIKKEYDSLRAIYWQKIDTELRAQIRSMSLRDQRKGFGEILRIGSKSQDRYGEEKFAPMNEKHVKQLIQIINAKGYPGEQLVGYEYWANGILWRHNSISPEYCRRDTLYPYIKPMLISAIRRGEMAPHALAVIEDWYFSVESSWQTAAYGYLIAPKSNDLPRVNQLRKGIGLRTIATRNGLIEIQEQTQMDFYLPPWPKKNEPIGMSDNK